MILHESEHAVVYHDDAEDVTLETESVDLVVTDPPYGVEYESSRRGQQSFGMIENDTEEGLEGVRRILVDAVRVVGQNRHLYVFGTSETDPLEGMKVSERTPIIWDKGRNGTGNLEAVWSRSHETIYFATSRHRHAGQTGESNLPVRLRRGTVLFAHPPTGRTLRHPTQKPTSILQELIESSSRPGETVFDPFAGIGSTGVAAILSGRRAILVEVNRDYALEAVARVRRAEALREEILRL